MGLWISFINYSEKELLPLILIFFQLIEETGTVPNIFYKFNIMLIPKTDRDTSKR